MELKAEALATVAATRKFFDRTTRCLEESDSTFHAHAATMSAAAHVAHTAQVVDWFRAGAFDGVWNMDFPTQQAETERVASLAEARRWLDAAWDRLTARLEQSSEDELHAAMPDNPILGTRARFHAVAAIVDHTGHHRGALAVYARLAGRTPEMPYAED